MSSPERTLTAPALAASVALALALACASSLLARDVPLASWPAPPGVLAIGASEATFVPVTPCRVVDTRNANGAFGGPALASGATRSFTVPSGPCDGIPASAKAYSLNVTVVAPVGAPTGSFLTLWPAGVPMPVASTLNFGSGAVVANATVVPAGTGGAVSTFANWSTHLILDVNGYYEAVLDSGNLTVTVDHDIAAVRATNGSDADYAAGVLGIATGSGVNYGVSGHTSGTAGSAGVRGLGANIALATYGVRGDGRGTGIDSAGVYGHHATNGTHTAHGVFGSVQSSGSQASGVAGRAVGAAANGGKFSNAGAGGVTAYLATRVSDVDYAVYTSSTVKCGTLQATTKNFVAPHPDDPSREIVYTSVEAPTADIYFRGSGRLSNGTARIEVPEHFRLSAREGTYATTLTQVGRGSIWVESEGPEGVTVGGTDDVAFHYVVWAERDAVSPQAPVRDNVSFTPDAIAKSGGIESLPEGYRAVLVRNGTLRPDGSFDERTARRLGWEIPGALSGSR